MNQLTKLLKECLPLLLMYENRQISKYQVSLLIASKLDTYRKELLEYKKVRSWPVELTTLISRIKRSNLKFDIVDDLVQDQVGKALSALKRLRENKKLGEEEYQKLKQTLDLRYK